MVADNSRNMGLEGLDEALSELERGAGSQNNARAFDIVVKHGISLNKTKVYLTGENVLIQAYELAEKELGFKPYSTKAVFVNEKTGKTTSDSEMSLNEFEIGEEETLTVFPDGKVAAK